jgi:hypothetical protein
MFILFDASYLWLRHLLLLQASSSAYNHLLSVALVLAALVHEATCTQNRSPMQCRRRS